MLCLLILLSSRQTVTFSLKASAGRTRKTEVWKYLESGLASLTDETGTGKQGTVYINSWEWMRIVFLESNFFTEKCLLKLDPMCHVNSWTKEFTDDGGLRYMDHVRSSLLFVFFGVCLSHVLAAAPQYFIMLDSKPMLCHI